MPAGAHDVIPHPRGGHRKWATCSPSGGRRELTFHACGAGTPGTGSPPASRSRREADGGGRRNPRHSRPTTACGAHDRESQRHGRERVRHDDLALVAEGDMASAGQFVQPPGDHREPGAEFSASSAARGARPVSANVRYTARRRSWLSIPPSSQSPPGRGPTRVACRRPDERPRHRPEGGRPDGWRCRRGEAEPEVELLVGGRTGRVGEPAGQVRVRPRRRPGREQRPSRS